MNDRRLSISLFTLRLGVFIVMFMWTLDKFVNPAHAGKVFEAFYFLGGMEGVMRILGAVELVLVFLFVLGVAKRFTYGTVLILHGISTLSSWRQYIDPFDNLLFFAAWPMLAAAFALYLLRDEDTLFTLGRPSRKAPNGEPSASS